MIRKMIEKTGNQGIGTLSNSIYESLIQFANEVSKISWEKELAY